MTSSALEPGHPQYDALISVFGQTTGLNVFSCCASEMHVNRANNHFLSRTSLCTQDQSVKYLVHSFQMCLINISSPLTQHSKRLSKQTRIANEDGSEIYVDDWCIPFICVNSHHVYARIVDHVPVDIGFTRA